MPNEPGAVSAYCMPSCKSVLVLKVLGQLSKATVYLLCDKNIFLRIDTGSRSRDLNHQFLILLSQTLERQAFIRKAHGLNTDDRRKNGLITYGKYFHNSKITF